MRAISFLSRAALAAGLPPRFRYWTGRSGRRYLFTALDSDLSGFGEGVAIAVRNDRIVWAISLEETGAPPATSCGTTLYLHLLAVGAEERQAVADDLSEADEPLLKQAA